VARIAAEGVTGDFGTEGCLPKDVGSPPHVSRTDERDRGAAERVVTSGGRDSGDAGERKGGPRDFCNAMAICEKALPERPRSRPSHVES